MRKFLCMFAVSWIFLPSTYSKVPPVVPHVEALPNPHYQIYDFQRTNIRGLNGSWDSYNRVYRNQQWPK